VRRAKAGPVDLRQSGGRPGPDNLTEIRGNTMHTAAHDNLPAAANDPAAPLAAASMKVACSDCSLRELCLPIGLSPQELARIDQLITTRRKVKRKTPLFRTGEPFHALYAIRTGVFKTCVTTEDGRDQVTGFQMAGEMVGLDGIVNDRHTCDAIALEDAEVCVLPFDRIGELSREVNALQHHLHRVMSREIVREHGVMLLLGTMRAEERVAAFLLNLVQRLQARGFSRSELVLRMTRQEIGSYLGLKLETVSRTLSRFAAEGLIEVVQRHVRIVDVERLRGLLAQPGSVF
jgi:CRP/FNR family transcriptional regulator